MAIRPTRRRQGNDDDGFDVVVEPEQFELKVGATVAGVRLVEPIERGVKIASWRGQRSGGTPVTLHALLPGATDRERGLFVRAAGRLVALRRDQFIPGVAPVTDVVPSADLYIAEVVASGTMADLPVLGWDFEKRLAFVQRVGVVLGTMHQARLFHGCLRPQNIMLDEQLAPVLADIGAVNIEDSFPGTAETRHEYWAYAAREVRQGAAADVASDVFSLGRLLYFVLAEEDPDEPDEDLPRLARLRDCPPGLVRIVRRATAREPSKRYEDVDTMLAEIGRFGHAQSVGASHPDAPEEKSRRREASEGRSDSKKGELRAGEPRRSDATSEPRRPEPKRPEPKRPEPKREAPRSSSSAQDSAFALGAARRSTDPLIGRVPLVLGGTGVTVLGVVAYLAYSTMNAKPWMALGGILGALLVSALLPATDRPLVVRPVWAVLCASCALLANPWAKLADAGLNERLSGITPSEKTHVIRGMLFSGRTSFVALDLSEVRLGGMRLAGVDFSGAKLDYCDMTNADMKSTKLSEADVTNCNFRGADFTGADVDVSIGWRESKCDDTTKMPEAWRCEKGAPKSKFDIPGIH